jgi:hypothetical protein
MVSKQDMLASHQYRPFVACSDARSSPCIADHLSSPTGSNGVGSDVPEYSSQFAFPVSASNSPLHPPPLSPVISAHAASGSAMGNGHGHHHHHHLHHHAVSSSAHGLGMASVPNSPFALTGGGGSPFGMHLASPGHGGPYQGQSVFQHHALSHAHAASSMAGHMVGSASPLHTDLGAPSHSPPPAMARSPAMNRFGGGFAGQFSPFTNHAAAASPFRPGLSAAPHSSSPYGMLSAHHAHSSHHSGGGVLKLEPPSNDPDYFMNLEENEGLTDLYAAQRVAASSDDHAAKGVDGPNFASAWPDDSDNIFSAANISASPPVATDSK